MLLKRRQHRRVGFQSGCLQDGGGSCLLAELGGDSTGFGDLGVNGRVGSGKLFLELSNLLLLFLGLDLGIRHRCFVLGHLLLELLDHSLRPGHGDLVLLDLLLERGANGVGLGEFGLKLDDLVLGSGQLLGNPRNSTAAGRVLSEPGLVLSDLLQQRGAGVKCRPSLLLERYDMGL